eukprot:c32335_g1_i1.p1 GENE.c32335_g1_i1~~c32335_g1_i1.p1  ORF type:complete len:399 (-),score=102.48 c32335_g1_i1:32-1198(-)
MSELLVELIQATHVPNADVGLGANRVDPYVRMWRIRGTNQDDKQTGELAWPFKPSTNNPTWHTSRNFGVPEEGDHILIQLWDRDLGSANDALGTSICPVADLLTGKVINVQISKKKSTTVSLRARLVTGAITKTIYIVRHGESAWNAAQKQKNIFRMWSASDHPLNAEGVEQALTLQEKTTRSDLNDLERGFVSAPAVFTSPLARALQTCIVGCYVPIKNLGGEVFLLPALRERKNVGGADSQGNSSSKGKNCVKSAVAKLGKHIKDTKEMDKYRAIKPVKESLQEVERRWWETVAESKAEVEIRVEDFLSTMRDTSHSSVIAVGHSLFFQDMFKHYLDEDYLAANPAVAEFQNKKLQNCGVIAIQVKFEGPHAKITQADLLFGSQLV